MALRLGKVLRQTHVSQARLASAISISQPAISQIINQNIWPKGDRDQLQELIIQKLILDFDVSPQHCRGLFDDDKDIPDLVPIQSQTEDKPHPEESMEEPMLLRKHTLTPEARQRFGLARDPFAEVRSADEVFMTPDIRYVRESLRSTAKHGGFAAVVGESGAGKSTLRRDLIEWAHKEHESIIVIEPYVVGLEDNDIKGKTLKASHIGEAIMHKLAPREHLKRSPETRFRQVHDALRESFRAGNRHVLIIEEAHGLPIPTLKHLKRFYELEDGFNRLLSIILIGQPELAEKLDERNPRVREIVQRCEMVTLRPLDLQLDGYLQHRFKMAGTDLGDVMDNDAVEALRTKLTGRGTFSALYPLAVHNVVTAALNEASQLGMPKLTADLIKGV